MKKRAHHSGLAKQLLDTIRREQRRRLRLALRLEKGGDESAVDAYQYFDEPFINDVCLLMLVSIWHQVEREVVRLAACVTAEGHVLTYKEYQERVELQRQLYRSPKTKPQVIKKLGLETLPDWGSHMETLRRLANCYKHDPSGRPDAELLRHLKMPAVAQERPLRVDYASLPESDHFRAGLARSLSLDETADYCTIVDVMLSRSDRFLHDVEQQNRISKVRGNASSKRFVG